MQIQDEEYTVPQKEKPAPKPPPGYYPADNVPARKGVRFQLPNGKRYKITRVRPNGKVTVRDLDTGKTRAVRAKGDTRNGV